MVFHGKLAVKRQIPSDKWTNCLAIDWWTAFSFACKFDHPDVTLCS